MFVDEATINVYGGDGGAGAEAFRREKYVARGGPSGGNGGAGGAVILEVDDQLNTLLDYRYHEHYHAERGQHGEGSNRTGKSGEDLRLRVPPGTFVSDADTGEELGELLEPGDELVVARGGRGAPVRDPRAHRDPRRRGGGSQLCLSWHKRTSPIG